MTLLNALLHKHRSLEFDFDENLAIIFNKAISLACMSSGDRK